MDYDALEVELVGVLNTWFGAKLLSSGPDVLLNTVFQARQMPENQNELLQDYSHSLVNVQYSDSTYDDTKATDQVIQDELIRVVCYIQANRMKGGGGGYRLLAEVKKGLQGYMPVGATNKMTISAYGDWRIEDGQMNPYIEFKFKAVAEQERDDNIPMATIDSVDSVSEGGPLLEVDASLYNGIDPETVIGTDKEILTT